MRQVNVSEGSKDDFDAAFEEAARIPGKTGWAIGLSALSVVTAFINFAGDNTLNGSLWSVSALMGLLLASLNYRDAQSLSMAHLSMKLQYKHQLEEAERMVGELEAKLEGRQPDSLS